MKAQVLLVASLLAAFPLAGCFGGDGGDMTLNGSGSTFITPLMSTWTSEYGKVNEDVRVNYASGGSGQGVTQISQRTVDFAATDAPMKDEELAAAGGKILHIPATLGGVAVIYNLPGVTSPLRLDAPTVAAIFEGEITRWNDARITGQNPNLTLPDQAIKVVVRSDGSGTTDTFTNYLAVAQGSGWGLGKGKSVNWPGHVQQAKGNEGVGNTVKTTPYTIGYAGSEWAFVSQIPMASLKNKEGNYVEPTLAAISAGAEAALSTLAADTRGSLVDPSGNASYPIVAMTWFLVHQEHADEAKAKAIVDFLWWAVHEGQQYADRDPLTYAKLPQSLVTKNEELLKQVTANGKPVRT